ncbi:PIN-like domain-containing protein [Actinomadura litoris]|uniref:PIN-like domain-containing protein n=1 Tax=Actinomadura litoris TaxID=2678616 RepID=UPI001FA74599|nr:PIN-like domain-containing protein [Actinomadura litoris]
MTDEVPDDDAPTADKASLRSLFPWHFGPPAGAQLERFLTTGLVVFDANALFDAYRLSPQGSAEFLRTLGLLGDRLWVPHRVAEEFLSNRLTVIRECAGAVTKLTNDLGGPFRKIKADIEEFGGRRGLAKDRVEEVLKLLSEAQQQIGEKISDSYQFDLKAADCLSTDSILETIENLLEGRIGPPLKDMQQVREEAAYRFERRIPPGYADATRKPPEQAMGDYVLWVQLLQEAERRSRPVLFVTNERKKDEDWTVKQAGGWSPLPRPELSAELCEYAGQPLHIVDVRSFLELANRYLDARVSSQTIKQAQTIEGADISTSLVVFQAKWRNRPSGESPVEENFRQATSLTRWELGAIRHIKRELEAATPGSIREDYLGILITAFHSELRKDKTANTAVANLLRRYGNFVSIEAESANDFDEDLS